MSDLMKRRTSIAHPFESLSNWFRSAVPDLPAWYNHAPAVDVKKQDNEYLVEADMPGMDAEDIDVNVEDNILTISSSKDEQKEESDEGYLMRERRSTSFRRRFELPADADQKAIDANFKNGLLTLHVPRTGEERTPSRKIDVKVE